MPFAKYARIYSPYTSIEIITAIAIVGALALIAALNILPKQMQTKEVRARHEILQIITQIEQYQQANNRYPTTQEGLRVLPGFSNYFKDPWGTPYQYDYPGKRNEYDVFSFGSDGKPGGIGVAQDIGNWQSETGQTNHFSAPEPD